MYKVAQSTGHVNAAGVTVAQVLHIKSWNARRLKAIRG